MSLHTLANHLQSAGRGEDKVLVHMTPGEVNGLQSLAMSQGGSLTINPETGLPEAGILSSLLPMVAGFFLGPAGLGLTAMQSAVTVGALGTAATGSLGKGFMMGLGAYGGAGLGEGLVKVGAPANVTPSVTDPTLGGFPQNQTLANAGVGPKIAPDTITGNTLGGADTFGNVTKEAGLKPLNLSDTPGFGQMNQKSIMFKDAPQGYITDTSPMGNYVSNMKADMLNPIQPNVVPSAPTVTNMSPKLDIPRPVDAGSNLSRGFDRATSSFEGAKEVWDATPKGTGYGLAATGISALQAQQEEDAKKAKAAADAAAAERRGYIRPYEFSTALTENAFEPRESTSEMRYFTEPRFTAGPVTKVAKDGGLMSLAVGGPVEEMSAANAMGANTGYPMANLQTPMYANPMMARPTPTNVISPSGDTGVNAYSGEMRMALGGSATASASAPKSNTKYSYNPETMKYTQVDTTTPAASNTMQDSIRGFYAPVFGMLPHFRTMGGGKLPGLDADSMKKFQQQIGSPQPAVTTQTMGGMAAPYTPPSGLAAADTSMMPNIQMQPQQNVDRQLGLEAFYPMMEQQLALKGSNLQAQGYANGGVARFGGGGTMAQPTAEGTARQKYARENKPGIIPSVSDEEWNSYKKLQNLSFPSAASSAPTYNYNPATMQYTDNVGKLTGGMDQSFLPPMMQQLTPEQQIGLSGYQGYAAGGGISTLGSYSDGGRLLRGPGDGVSDSIPASIGDRQPARLADGEFVVPARIVSEIGNGSTEAGARKLYAMMDRVQKARKKTVGKNQVAKNTKADKLLPA